MATIQISRGPAALPSDLEYRFCIAFGREMTVEERELWSFTEVGADIQQTELDQMFKAA